MKRWICQEVWGAPSVTNSRVEFALVTETSRLARSLVQTVLGAASGDVVSVAGVFPNLDWVNSRMCLERCSRTTPFYDPSLFLSLSLRLFLLSTQFCVSIPSCLLTLLFISASLRSRHSIPFFSLHEISRTTQSPCAVSHLSFFSPSPSLSLSNL